MVFHSENESGPGPGTAGIPAEMLDRLLSQMTTILAVVDKIFQLLAGVRKSHYTVEEVGELTGRAPYTVRTWIKQGVIKATRVNVRAPRGDCWCRAKN